jgi:outer membrane immunogenic protein
MTTMLKLFSAAAAIAMFAGSAQAADGSVVPDSPSWSGPYIGVVGGFGWGDSDFASDVVDATDNSVIIESLNGTIKVEGFLLGGQLGYDFDLGNGFVLGVVGDMSWSNMDGDTCVEDAPGCDGSPDDSYASADVNWLGMIRGRAGYALGSLLIYGTGGLAIADADSSVTFIEGGADPKRSDSNTHIGWVIGAGAEFRISDNMSLGAEYLRVETGAEAYAFRGPTVDVLSDADLTLDIVRASLNFRF